MCAWWPSLETWETAGKLAPIATALTALIAVGVAYRALRVQRDLARKRAAVDFFFKTEMDKGIADSYQAYEAIRRKYKTKGTVIELYNNNEDLLIVLAYLNINKLIAVGIHAGIFDENVCFEFWSDELMAVHRDWKQLIDHMRKADDSIFSYVDLERLAFRWEQRDATEKRKRQRMMS